jgi:hypothetical protein
MRILQPIVALLLAASCVVAQQAVVRKSTSLRADPTTSEPPEATLQVGDQLTLLDPTAENGYYQVKTKTGTEGWVSLRAVKILASPSSANPTMDPESLSPGLRSQCDDTLWTHVYHPHRLIVKQQCITVTGTIVDATNGRKSDGVRHEPDGDTHGWLQVDPQFQDLLNAGNMSDEGGNLVFEIVCKFHATQPDAIASCSGFDDPIAIPPVGSHVEITGTYVRDTFHAHWMEIHPVSSIKVIE